MRNFFVLAGCGLMLAWSSFAMCDEDAMGAQAIPVSSNDEGAVDGKTIPVSSSEEGVSDAQTTPVLSSDEGAVDTQSITVSSVAESSSYSTDEVNSLFKALEFSMFPSSAFARMTLTSYKNDKELKEMAMEFVVKDDNVLIEIKSPRFDRGKYILKAGNDLWMYFSEIHRSIRIASRDSFMGTDANNYDLLELDLIDDYELVSHSTEVRDGRPLIRAVLDAKPDTEGYARIVSYLDPEKKIIIQNDCYAISGTLLKTISYFEHHYVGSYFVPGKITFVSKLEVGRHSVVTFQEVEKKAGLDSSIFSLGYLESLN